MEKATYELRELVLTAASPHPVFPVGMDVNIRVGSGGWWMAECIPPKDSNIAYADACYVVGRAVRGLRELYAAASNSEVTGS